MALGIVFVGLSEMSCFLDIVRESGWDTSIKNLGARQHACIVTSPDQRSQVFNNGGEVMLSWWPMVDSERTRVLGCV